MFSSKEANHSISHNLLRSRLF